MDGVLLLDLREKAEYDEFHVQVALLSHPKNLFPKMVLPSVCVHARAYLS